MGLAMKKLTQSRSSIVRRKGTSHVRFARLRGLLVTSGVVCAASGLLWPETARAQLAGASTKPLPDVLLLVDTSGSMERMPDGTLPSASAPCNPGFPTSANRWGMLLQALTGNMQPFYSCEALDRSQPAFLREYSIHDGTNPIAPYDKDYFLPYHRPMTGNGLANTCVMAPYLLPGNAGIGPNNRRATGAADTFPDDAIISVKRSYLNSTNQALTTPYSAILDADKCIFDQTPDGQLDAARDYARFALMTFDNDPDERLGVSGTDHELTPVLPATSVQPPFLGQWSYYRSTGAVPNPFYQGAMTPPTSLVPIPAGAAKGHPAGCAFSPFEVGARNEFAPPWEGRLVKFAAPDASLYDIQRVNDEIQKVLLATRPFGATPIDGMMDDARDYYWYRPDGVRSDTYQCRDKFIILLTDGAPNLDLRPSCGPTGAGDYCPYPQKAAEIAHDLYMDATKRVTTYVIGFSVNGVGTAGFPPGFDAFPNNNCKSWFTSPSGGNNNPLTFQTICNGPSKPAAGTTADACCQLNEIALNGSNSTEGPFFAESQADIVLAFGKVLANVIKSATTRTIPVTTPVASFSSINGQGTTGTFVASFIPNSQRPWSGEIDRARNTCDAAGNNTPVPQNANQGDFMSSNLARQSSDKERVFFSVAADKLTDGSIDSQSTIRPWLAQAGTHTGGPNDGIPKPEGAGGTPVYDAREVFVQNNLTLPTDWPLAMGIDANTCKQGRAILQGSAGSRGTVAVPALTNPVECTEVMWGFETAYGTNAINRGIPAYNFNVRCTGSASATSGKCSVSGENCTLGGPSCDTLPGGVTGEICVPECAALGAVYRSNPTVLSPPSSFLREEGFRSYQAARNDRRQVLFAVTSDGILHAFKATNTGDQSTRHELWSFVPPAVLPKIAGNYPTGNQVLLDGSPIVRDAVFERLPADASGSTSGNTWHTMLVAGLGSGNGGYYALNVSDADCGGKNSTNDCLNPANRVVANNLGEASMGGHLLTDATVKRGPHFMWQITDVLKSSSPGEVVTRKHNNNDLVSLFGKQTSTPAIGMVQITTSSVQKQVGVAILPGGINSPPFKTPGQCARGAAPRMHDALVGGVRPNVRQWGKTCADPVPGRGVTIVRLDTGEVIKHFGRLIDTPTRLHGRTRATDFDSPMIGTPVIYPDVPGVPIQKVYIGDADGTLWRMDLTSTNPADWSVSLFQDLIPAPKGAADSQPIQVPPVVSLDDAGQVVVNVATGDQDSIVKNGDENYLYSLRETRTGAAGAAEAKVNWFKIFHDNAAPCSGTCEGRVTGPMVVFDRTLYFATYTPVDATATGTPPVCGVAGRAMLWGVHFTEPDGTAASGNAGLPRFCPALNVNAAGVCTTALVQSEAPPGGSQDVIPGVTLTPSMACATTGATDEVGGNGYGSMTTSEFMLSFAIARPRGAPGGTVADRNSIRRPLPRTSTRIDGWSLVIE